IPCRGRSPRPRTAARSPERSLPCTIPRGMHPDAIREEFFGHEHVTVLEPPKGFHWLDPREIWAYRELLGVLIQRDIRVRYRQAVLGVAWALLRPVLGMAIF